MGGLLAITDKFVDHLRDAWRSRWWGLSGAAIVFAIGWIVVIMLPSVYEAKASVYVNTSSSLAPMLKGLAVESDLDSQLEMVKQLLLSHELLEAVVSENGLQKSAGPQTDVQQVSVDLRRRIQLSGGRNSRDNLYTITFRDPDRAKALAVVRSLLTHFIEKAIGTKRGATDSATRFLESQKAEYETRLSSAENQLAAFKRRNMGLLPGEQLDYFNKLQLELQTRMVAQSRLDQLRSQREQIRKQLSGESPVTTLPGAGTEMGAASADPNVIAGNPLDRRIAETENKLNQMRLQWTNEHPDVIAQRELLTRLKEERATYLKALGVKGRGDGPISIEGNPVYASLRMALSQVDLKIFELTAEIASHSKTIAMLERAADTVPQVEAQYQQLNRDYSVLNGEYQEVVKRLETARLSGQADQSENVDFRIIVPASAPALPVAPKRLLLLSGVFVLGVALGLWVAMTRSRMTPVFYTVRDVSLSTNLLVLGAVGNTLLTRVTSLKRRSVFGFVAATAVLVATFGLAMASELMYGSVRGQLFGIKLP
jgi:polysaccharide chain length determinant protein (PEP-CTERM system associated)